MNFNNEKSKNWQLVKLTTGLGKHPKVFDEQRVCAFSNVAHPKFLMYCYLSKLDIAIHNFFDNNCQKLDNFEKDLAYVHI